MNSPQSVERTSDSVIRPAAFRRPAVIALIVAAVSIASMLVVNHTNLIVDRRPPPTPPGTTFNTVNGAGGTVSPTLPEPSINPTAPGPAPVQPANPTK
jgi:hypothetical protein